MLRFPAEFLAGDTRIRYLQVCLSFIQRSRFCSIISLVIIRNSFAFRHCKSTLLSSSNIFCEIVIKGYIIVRNTSQIEQLQLGQQKNCHTNHLVQQSVLYSGHSTSLNPVNTISPSISSGRFTSIPSEASSSICFSSLI